MVTSPKTEHHPGKERRTIPLFPELRDILLEAAELAPKGAIYVGDEKMRACAQGRLAKLQSVDVESTFSQPAEFTPNRVG